MKSVVIVSTNAIGDSYISCAAIEVFKRQTKNVNIDLITLHDSICFTEYLGLNKVYYVKTRSIINLFKLKKQLKDKSYNIAFSFFPGRFNTLIIDLLKCNNKYCYRNYLKVLDWHERRQHLYVNSHKTDVYWDSTMNYLDRINNPLSLLYNSRINSNKPKFNFQLDFKKSIEPQVIINAKSRDKRRNISPFILEELINFIEKSYKMRTYVLNFDNYYHNYLKSSVLLNVSDFPTIVSRIVYSKLFITVDSFLLHVGDAYKINMLSLFNMTSPTYVCESKNQSSLEFDYNDIRNISIIKIKIENIMKENDTNRYIKY